jgi:hypothetical protein
MSFFPPHPRLHPSRHVHQFPPSSSSASRISPSQTISYRNPHPADSTNQMPDMTTLTPHTPPITIRQSRHLRRPMASLNTRPSLIIMNSNDSSNSTHNTSNSKFITQVSKTRILTPLKSSIKNNILLVIDTLTAATHPHRTGSTRPISSLHHIRLMLNPKRRHTTAVMVCPSLA